MKNKAELTSDELTSKPTSKKVSESVSRFEAPIGRVFVKPASMVSHDENYNNFNATVLSGSVKYYVPESDKNKQVKLWLSDKEKKWFEEHTGIEVTQAFLKDFIVRLSDSGLILDKSNPQDYFIYKFLLSRYPIFALPKNQNSFTQFVITDEESDNIDKISHDDKVYECMAIIKTEMNEATRGEFLRLYGESTFGLSSATILRRLMDYVKGNPDRFMDMYKDGDLDMKIFLESLLQAQLITKRNMNYFYGEDPMGVSIIGAVEWLRHPDNNHIFIHLKTQLSAFVSNYKLA